MGLELRRKESDVVPLHRATACYAKFATAIGMKESSGAPGVADAQTSTELAQVEEATFIVNRLEAMALLIKTEMRRSETLQPIVGPVLKLGGGLDTEDLATALLGIEDNEGIRELLQRDRQHE